jgi:hypothetical protein
VLLRCVTPCNNDDFARRLAVMLRAEVCKSFIELW